MVNVLSDQSIGTEGNNTGAIERPGLATESCIEAPVHHADLSIHGDIADREADIIDVLKHMTEDLLHGVDASHVIERVLEADVRANEFTKRRQRVRRQGFQVSAISILRVCHVLSIRRVMPKNTLSGMILNNFISHANRRGKAISNALPFSPRMM